MRRTFQELFPNSCASARNVYNQTVMASVAAHAPALEWSIPNNFFKGLLVEAAATNFVPNSVLTTAAPTQTIAPSGTLNFGLGNESCYTVPDNIAATHTFLFNGQNANSVKWCFSFYIQMNDNSTPRLGTGTNTDVELMIGNAAVPASQCGLEQVFGNVWRVWGQATPASGSGTAACGFRKVFGSTSTKGFRASGFMLERDVNRPTSFIRTTTASVTRAVSAPANTIGSWFNTSGGTIVVELPTIYDSTGGGQVVWVLDGAGGYGSSGGIILGITATNNQYILYARTAGGVSSSTTLASMAQTVGLTAVNKVAVAFDGNAPRICVNGGTVQTTSSVPPLSAVTRLALGVSVGSPVALNAHIRNFQYIPRAFSNSELQEITR